MNQNKFSGHPSKTKCSAATAICRNGVSSFNIYLRFFLSFGYHGFSSCFCVCVSPLRVLSCLIQAKECFVSLSSTTNANVHPATHNAQMHRYFTVFGRRTGNTFPAPTKNRPNTKHQPTRAQPASAAHPRTIHNLDPQPLPSNTQFSSHIVALLCPLVLRRSRLARMEAAGVVARTRWKNRRSPRSIEMNPYRTSTHST